MVATPGCFAVNTIMVAPPHPVQVATGESEPGACRLGGPPLIAFPSIPGDLERSLASPLAGLLDFHQRTHALVD
jgi:hypothetical protein